MHLRKCAISGAALDFGQPKHVLFLQQQVSTGCCPTGSTSCQVSKFELGILGIDKGSKAGLFVWIHLSMHHRCAASHCPECIQSDCQVRQFRIASTHRPHIPVPFSSSSSCFFKTMCVDYYLGGPSNPLPSFLSL